MTQTNPISPAAAPQPGGTYKIPALLILSEITASLAGESDLEDLLKRFLGTMIRLAGANAGAVRILTADGTQMRLIGSIGLPPAVVEKERYVPVNCGICGQAVREQAIRSSADLHVCTEQTGHRFFGQDCEKIFAIPLSHKNKILGVYNLFMSSDRDVPDEVALLFQSISEHLGMALENARLTRENMRITLMNERQMLANEIHDSLAQTLAYMKMRLTLLQDAVQESDSTKSSKYLSDVSQALDSAYSGLRELLTHFRNRMHPHGLLAALQELASNFHDKTGIVLDFSNHAPDLNLTVDQEVQVFYIVQEALANVCKHSLARHARLVLEMQQDRYIITIEDDGVGADSRKKIDTDAHFGMSIMQERAQRLGGEVVLESRPGQGMRVQLKLPVIAVTQENPATIPHD